MKGFTLNKMTCLSALLGLMATVLATTTARAQTVTLVTFDKEQKVTVVNYVPGKHLIVRGGSEMETVPLTDVLMLSYSTDPAPISPAAFPAVWLESGGRLVVSSITAADTQLAFSSGFAGEGKLDINKVRAIAFHKAVLNGTVASEFAGYLKTPPKTDVLFVAGSQKEAVPLEGLFVRLDDVSVVFRWQDKEQVVSREKVVALVLAPVRRTEVDRSEFVSVTGTDGSELHGRLAEMNAESVTLEVSGLGSVRVEVAKVAAIDFVFGRAVNVSALEPVQVEEVPYFDHIFHFRRDASVGGRQLSIGGVRFPHGLGVHSRCALTYALGKQYRWLTGYIGIDDEVGRMGSVVFKVIADGREIYASGNVKGGEAARRISLDVKGVDNLTLVVDFGEDMDIADHADWAALRLIR